MSISLIAALGNPGREYEATRHNLGWVVVDSLAARHRLSCRVMTRFEAEVCRWDIPGRDTLWIVKPLSFMNDSGRPVSAFARFHGIDSGRVAAVYDDVAIPLGRVKVAESGSAGGHNGVASLLEHLGDGFVRYRLGIGPRQPREMDLSNFVLGRFSPAQLQIVNQNLNTYIDGLELLLNKGVATAMNLLNRRDTNEPEQA
jgi:PTH1 family peptidyl-tRNA hydrolase